MGQYVLMSPLFYIFGSVLIISAISLSGAVFLSLGKGLLKKMMVYLVSFATGAMFANVFLHILPEVVDHAHHSEEAFQFVLLGIIISFVLEKFVHWHHCHNLECKHIQPAGTMMLIGDGAHNLLDGVLIATTYLVDIHLGIATTIAIALHEIPQEIGDFAVLLHSGYSKAKALLFNMLSALLAIAGAIIVLVARNHIMGIEHVLLPIIAGNFLYIAGSDLIPELHKQQKPVYQLLAMLAGIAVIALALGDAGHAH